MSIDLFVPEVWSARLLRHLDARLVYAQAALTNRNYEGEISQSGDTVHIQKVNDPTIQDYVKGTPMTPERPDGTTIPLAIDRDKGFYVQMDDLDAIQVNVPLFEQFTGRAGRKMAEEVDADVAARQVAGAGIQIASDGTPATLTADPATGDFTFWELAVEARRLLDNAEAPEEDRWLVLNPDQEAIALSDDRFIPAAALGDGVTRTGRIGQIAGFDVLKTTRTPSSPGSGGTPVPNHKVVFGAGNYSTTFANQLVKTEAERLQGLFEDAVKGRSVWGAKIIEAATLGVAHIAD